MIPHSQWKQRFLEIDRLVEEGKIRVIKGTSPYRDPDNNACSLYVLTCPNCKSEHSHVIGTYLWKILNRKFCKLCWRNNPDLPSNNYKSLERVTEIPIDFPSNTKMGCADIYIRVSSKSQMKGDGLRRQEEYGIAYCKQNCIKVRHIIQDVCSAYSKDNCVNGNLGFKMRDWENGKEAPPQFLVLEDMDRFSRQEIGIVIGHLNRIKNLGIKFVTTGICCSEVIVM
jgi:hypothetical protein